MSTPPLHPEKRGDRGAHRSRRHWHLAWLATAFLGCGAGRFVRGSEHVGGLAVRAVEWNPEHAEVGSVAAVADAGDDLLVVGDQGARIFVAGSPVATDRRLSTWRSAAAIPAANGGGTWLAALDGSGALHRVRARTSLEPISDRYGLAGKAITAFAALGSGRIGFALAYEGPSPVAPTPGFAGSSPAAPTPGFASSSPAAPTPGLVEGSSFAGPPGSATGRFGAPAASGLLAVADGVTVTTFSLGPAGAIAGGGGKAAWPETGGVRVFEPGRAESRFFPLAGATRAALDDGGRLFAATQHEVYAEDATGTLALVYETAAEATTITGLVASAGRVWFSEGADLGVVLGGRAAVTTGLRRPEEAVIVASSSGDVWSLAAGTLTRFAVTEGPTAARALRWKEVIAPVLGRACAACHGASHSSGIDLSTFDAWEKRLALLRRRVIESRDMPPRGHALDEADREIIDAWTR